MRQARSITDLSNGPQSLSTFMEKVRPRRVADRIDLAVQRRSRGWTVSRHVSCKEKVFNIPTIHRR